MITKSASNLFRIYKKYLDKLSNTFSFSEAREIGLNIGILQSLKIRGVLSYKRTGIRDEGIWKKEYTAKSINIIKSYKDKVCKN